MTCVLRTTERSVRVLLARLDGCVCLVMLQVSYFGATRWIHPVNLYFRGYQLLESDLVPGTRVEARLGVSQQTLGAVCLVLGG